jgi:hypothetical protein
MPLVNLRHRKYDIYDAASRCPRRQISLPRETNKTQSMAQTALQQQIRAVDG